MLRLILVLFFFITILHAKNTSDKNEVESRRLGYVIGKSIRTQDLNLNIDAFLEGIKDNEDKLASPLEKDYFHLINRLQDFLLNEKKTINLFIANNFLEINKYHPRVTEVIPGKVQYKLINEGIGDPLTEENTPLVIYKCSTLDNQIIFETSEPQVVSLEDLIPGFLKGLVGMKEGGKRIIYIHPDYGFQKSDNLDTSFLIKFEVELLKCQYNFEINKSLISNLNNPIS